LLAEPAEGSRETRPQSDPRFDGDWYLEFDRGGYVQGLRVRSRLAKTKTPFQQLEIIETDLFGRCLILDNALQTSERDEFMYHEMLVHTALMTHPNPDRVLIIGGGDGGSLRRALMHRQTRPIQVEIDEAVISFCREHIPAISNGAFDNPRAQVVIADGFEYMRQHRGQFDVVIVDSTDPVGPAIPLFEEPFYRDVFAALAEGGLMVAQSNSPIYMQKELASQRTNLRAVFPIVRTYLGAVPMYPGGVWSYTIASKQHDPMSVAPEAIATRLSESTIETRYYSPQVHRAAFQLPGFIAELAS
jgi:spermidine synthase